MGVLSKDSPRFQSYVAQTRIDVAECLTQGFLLVQVRLLNLAPMLRASGCEFYADGNVIVGVKLPWRADVFLGILLRSCSVPQALQAAAPGAREPTFSLSPGRTEKKRRGLGTTRGPLIRLAEVSRRAIVGRLGAGKFSFGKAFSPA